MDILILEHLKEEKEEKKQLLSKEKFHIILKEKSIWLRFSSLFSLNSEFAFRYN